MSRLPFSQVWKDALTHTSSYGHLVAPRGQKTRESLCSTVTFDLARPILISPIRAPGYKFMAAEAAWILSGSNQLAAIRPYAKMMEKFSDDGVVLAGAYGPKVVSQFSYVVDSLVNDVDSRQAVMTLWAPNPASSKDIPCTVAIDFKIRAGCLYVQVFMRSSDQWLGLPYDSFSFSMIAYAVCSEYNRRVSKINQIKPAVLSIVAASSHQYERDWALIDQVINANPGFIESTDPTAQAWLYDGTLTRKELAALLWEWASLDHHFFIGSLAWDF